MAFTFLTVSWTMEVRGYFLGVLGSRAGGLLPTHRWLFLDSLWFCLNDPHSSQRTSEGKWIRLPKSSWWTALLFMSSVSSSELTVPADISRQSFKTGGSEDDRQGPFQFENSTYLIPVQILFYVVKSNCSRGPVFYWKFWVKNQTQCHGTQRIYSTLQRFLYPRLFAILKMIFS